MAMIPDTSLTPDLAECQREAEHWARHYGLDFFPTVFELVDAEQLNSVAAYGGFPTRYPHWRFGMEYARLSKGYNYGLQKIYELVINNDPCYAYLMNCNDRVDQKLVMAHVYGHCDFFKNNQWFAHTNRKMMDEMANHGNRVRRYIDRYGIEEVEEFVDACLSIEDLIDIHSPHIKRRDDRSRYDFTSSEEEAGDEDVPGRFQAKDYMEAYINPPDQLAADKARLQAQRERAENFPAHPERDVMLFLLEHAPLKPWQVDVLSIIRDEAYYFAPQGQTKIMNEGWASYWHSTIMTHNTLSPAEVVCYCDHHSGTLASSPTQLNPYKLGIELFRDIEDRWNRGRFGKEYDDCDDMAARREWNVETNQGRDKIFEVRRIHNDLTFIDTFLTLDFCRQYKMFQFGYNPDTEYYEIESRAFPKIKHQLLENLTNMSRPQIAVRDANYKNRGELFLEHTFTGVELKVGDARDTLANLQRLWRRPVHIETVLDDHVTTLSFDGSEHKLHKGEEVCHESEE